MKDTADNRRAAVTKIGKPCRVCKRLTLAPSRICDRHPKSMTRFAVERIPDGSSARVPAQRLADDWNRRVAADKKD